MIPVTEPVIGDREVELVTEAVSSGWVSPAGPFVERFESEFAKFLGADHAIATSTGTAALHLALESAGIGRGDEVIVPSLTWIACANVVQYTGAKPVFVDVEPDSLTIDVESVQAAVTEDTAAIMPVHLYGHPCAMDEVMECANRNDLMVLEDGAEAQGAMYEGEPVGTIGDAGCFSFYGNKIMTTGQGGMIVTDDDGLADRVRLLRRDGMGENQKYHHPVIGYNYRLTNIQAALGVAQLERINTLIREKRRVAGLYEEHLPDEVALIGEKPNVKSVRWMTIALFRTEEQMESVTDALSNANIETRPLFLPLHLQPPYATASDCEFSVSEDVSARGLNLPSGPTLSRNDVKEICSIIRRTIVE